MVAGFWPVRPGWPGTAKQAKKAELFNVILRQFQIIFPKPAGAQWPDGNNKRILHTLRRWLKLALEYNDLDHKRVYL
jgi:hypothetical protein